MFCCSCFVTVGTCQGTAQGVCVHLGSACPALLLQPPGHWCCICSACIGCKTLMTSQAEHRLLHDSGSGVELAESLQVESVHCRRFTLSFFLHRLSSCSLQIKHCVTMHKPFHIISAATKAVFLAGRRHQIMPTSPVLKAGARHSMIALGQLQAFHSIVASTSGATVVQELCNAVDPPPNHLRFRS